MPRKGNSPPTKKKPDPNAGRRYYCLPTADWGGYCELRINEDERGDFDGWFNAPDSTWQAIFDDLLAEGISVGLKWDAASDCFVATLTGKLLADYPERYCVTARSPYSIEALALSVYKFGVLMDGTADNYYPKTQRVQTWG